MASLEQETTVQIHPDELVNSVIDEDASLAVRRLFTIEGRDPYDEVEWETRDAHIPGKNGPAFEQRGVEFPKFWSQTATNIVAQKYFRGRMSSPERERSVKQMIGRIVTTVGTWGRDGGYFASDDEAQTFEDELKAILVNQLAAFNSPVWFNVGFEEKPQCSACFILSIDDSMDAILDWIRREGIIFRGGSGSGVNLSRLRSSKEQLSKGGYASGPVSFMRGADASAGTIKSGGKTRRAAKMVVLDVRVVNVENDHLGGPSGGTARLDRARGGVGAAHERHRAARGTARRQQFLAGPDTGEVHARTRTALEDEALFLVPLEDRVHRVVDGQDEAVVHPEVA
jgi:ribonucleotide reductase alpha subunit